MGVEEAELSFVICVAHSVVAGGDEFFAAFDDVERVGGWGGECFVDVIVGQIWSADWSWKRTRSDIPQVEHIIDGFLARAHSIYIEEPFNIVGARVHGDLHAFFHLVVFSWQRFGSSYETCLPSVTGLESVRVVRLGFESGCVHFDGIIHISARLGLTRLEDIIELQGCRHLPSDTNGF